MYGRTEDNGAPEIELPRHMCRHVPIVTNSIQPYKYNGKERNARKELKWYDYGARHYDAALGRFTTVDPMAEKYYSIGVNTYCNNNPVRYIDPTGMFMSPIYDEEGV